MRVSAFLMAIVLVATPALPQSVSPPKADQGAQDSDATLIEISEDLQRVFDLVKQPGFHPELLELLEIEVSPERPLGTPPAAGMRTWHWVLIGVGVGILVLVVLAAAKYRMDVCAAPSVTCTS